MILFNKKTPQSLGSLYPFIVTKKTSKNGKLDICSPVDFSDIKKAHATMVESFKK